MAIVQLGFLASDAGVVGGGAAEAHTLGEAGLQRQTVGLVAGEPDGDAGVGFAQFSCRRLPVVGPLELGRDRPTHQRANRAILEPRQSEQRLPQPRVDMCGDDLTVTLCVDGPLPRGRPHGSAGNWRLSVSPLPVVGPCA